MTTFTIHAHDSAPAESKERLEPPAPVMPTWSGQWRTLLYL